MAAMSPQPPVAASLPAPPSPQATPQPAAARPTTGQARPIKPLALAGGAALVVATFLPWLSGVGSSVNALDLPIQALWDVDAQDGAVKLGFALLAFGAVGIALAFVPGPAALRRLCGSLGVAAVLAFAAQLYRAIDAQGGTLGDVFDVIGVGLYVALAGAVALQVSR